MSEDTVRFGTEGKEVFMEVRVVKPYSTEISTQFFDPNGARSAAYNLCKQADILDGGTTQITVQPKKKAEPSLNAVCGICEFTHNMHLDGTLTTDHCTGFRVATPKEVDAMLAERKARKEAKK